MTAVRGLENEPRSSITASERFLPLRQGVIGFIREQFGLPATRMLPEKMDPDDPDPLDLAVGVLRYGQPHLISRVLTGPQISPDYARRGLLVDLILYTSDQAQAYAMLPLGEVWEKLQAASELKEVRLPWTLDDVVALAMEAIKIQEAGLPKENLGESDRGDYENAWQEAFGILHTGLAGFAAVFISQEGQKTDSQREILRELATYDTCWLILQVP